MMFAVQFPAIRWSKIFHSRPLKHPTAYGSKCTKPTDFEAMLADESESNKSLSPWEVVGFVKKEKEKKRINVQMGRV